MMPRDQAPYIRILLFVSWLLLIQVTFNDYKLHFIYSSWNKLIVEALDIVIFEGCGPTLDHSKQINQLLTSGWYFSKEKEQQSTIGSLQSTVKPIYSKNLKRTNLQQLTVKFPTINCYFLEVKFFKIKSQ